MFFFISSYYPNIYEVIHILKPYFNCNKKNFTKNIQLKIRFSLINIRGYGSLWHNPHYFNIQYALKSQASPNLAKNIKKIK